MDRAGNVDSVDGSEVSVDANDSGWDAYAVWRERVHGARAGTHGASRPVRDAARETAAPGWDPLQTWHGRVHLARRRDR